MKRTEGEEVNVQLISIAEYKSRRQALCRQIGPDAHALIVSAPAPNDRAPFRQYNDFYYLCGVAVPQSYLLIEGRTGKATLFLPDSAALSRESNEVWLHADDAVTAQSATGIDTVLERKHLSGALAAVRVLYTFLRDGEGLKTDVRSITDAQRQIEMDPWDGRPSRGGWFVSLLQSRFPGIEILDLAPIVYAMRMIKSDSEIALLRMAGELSAKALIEAMRMTRPGVFEYELAAAMQYQYLAGGARDNSYAPIVATGANIVNAHYCANNCELVAGDLVLADCAPDYHYYTSDITRMWPVNGTYTPEQRTLYGFVTEFHKALLDAIRPGRTCEEIEIEAAECMRLRLGEFDFATAAQRKGVQEMIACRNHLAHSVGLSVHDGLSHKQGPLKAGMVFAVDPQLYVREEGLYIRVEDTGVVTQDGFEVFTSGVTLDLDEIEKLCQSRLSSDI